MNYTFLKVKKRLCVFMQSRNPTDQSDFVRSIAPQAITFVDQSYGLIGTIYREAIDSKN